jgi:hypothetical protein
MCARRHAAVDRHALVVNPFVAAKAPPPSAMNTATDAVTFV